ncbi:MAG: LOW QUALITY PROTEIN: putative phosphatase regulatory subunit-domain-containing protein [Linnemannia elongata]|nr:MAG: LOW QUALITY PROTEIN: putative phosphatase regulatory subunit-domain-containing protein [Linnemannia elongata]
MDVIPFLFFAFLLLAVAFIFLPSPSSQTPLSYRPPSHYPLFLLPCSSGQTTPILFLLLSLDRASFVPLFCPSSCLTFGTLLPILVFLFSRCFVSSSFCPLLSFSPPSPPASSPEFLFCSGLTFSSPFYLSLPPLESCSTSSLPSVLSPTILSLWYYNFFPLSTTSLILPLSLPFLSSSIYRRRLHPIASHLDIVSDSFLAPYPPGFLLAQSPFLPLPLCIFCPRHHFSLLKGVHNHQKMSYSTSADTPPRPFVVSSPDRVLVRALPHPLASTNKKVTLSLRRTTPSQPSSSSQPLSPQSPLTPDTPTSTVASSEPSRAPLNIQIPNSPRRISMLSSLASPMNGDQDAMASTRRLTGVTGGSVAVSAAAQEYSRPSFATIAQTTSPTKKYSAQFHKNGLPIKSAMKSPVTTPVDVKTSPVALCRPSSIRSYSSPTPLTSPKYVHFNTQLEHVRLFLQGETPACVGERETLVDPRQHDRSTSDIKVALSNWTPVVADSFQPVNIDSGAAPLRVETVVLSDDQTELRGKILVQNIAFHKHVSVRYTIDFWQTQCEVGAEFEESIKGTSVDRFSFVIPLDMERTMTFCLAVRYRFWDSNNGMNYHIESPPTMTSLLLVADYSKPVLKKKLASRYDLTSSLSAAYSQPIANPTRATASNLPFGVARTASPNGFQTAYRPSEYITPSPPQNYHHSLYASSPKFMNPYLTAASPPEHFRVGFDMLSLDRPMRGTRTSWNVDIDINSAHSSSTTSANGTSAITIPSGPTRPQSYPASAPISIPTNRQQQQQQQGGHRPAVGSSSYFDLSSPHTSPYSSYPNSPPAPCIRG